MSRFSNRLAAAGTAARGVGGPTFRRPLNGSAAAVLTLTLLVGCGQSEPSRPAAPQQPVVNVPPPPPPPPSLEKPPQPAREKAAVGVGEKGRGYSAAMYPAATYWAIKEKLAFEVQIPKAMQLFKATEGRAPRDHEEFMQRIIKEGMIKLPDLPPGDRYVYDPKREELMVEHTGP